MSDSFLAYTWFVTGASGLVGSAIVEKLRENDLKVIALVREETPEPMIEFLLDLDVKIVIGDILERSSYQGDLAACDVVVHSAAAVREEDLDKNFRINLEGTREVCKAMQEVGISRLIHISTAGVYGKTYSEKVPETTIPKPFGAYRESKYEAEKAIIYEYPDLIATILRPPFVFGDIYRDRHLYKTLINNFPTKILPRVWRRNPKLGFVHAEDIARMVLLSGSKGKTPSMIYNVQSFSITLEELYEIIYSARGSEPRTFPIPFSFLYVGALVGEVFLKMIGRSLPLRKRLGIARKNWTFSTKRAQEELGFEPIHRDKSELERLLSDYYEITQSHEGIRSVNMQDYFTHKN